MRPFEEFLTPEQYDIFARLNSPTEIQAYLDATPYNPGYENRCVPSVLRDRIAHCLDGGLFAAAALRRLGYPPVIVDLLPEPGQDDDHVLAIYRVDGCYGAVAKSNFAGLRRREPVYRSLRELVMSYFEWFYNLNGRKTLRGYTRPVTLAAFDRYGWMWSDSGVDVIEKHLFTLKATPLLTPEMAARLSPLDSLTFQAGSMGVNFDGVYRPKE